MYKLLKDTPTLEAGTILFMDEDGDLGTDPQIENGMCSDYHFFKNDLQKMDNFDEWFELVEPEPTPEVNEEAKTDGDTITVNLKELNNEAFPKQGVYGEDHMLTFGILLLKKFADLDSFNAGLIVKNTFDIIFKDDKE